MVVHLSMSQECFLSFLEQNIITIISIIYQVAIEKMVLLDLLQILVGVTSGQYQVLGELKAKNS
ncbi:hypothetical protein SDC9_95369 [bioreactor metagenome]|uniref:Uncharacterized protein n=1 Tax=bioreactor metagenome TaxID=1076179 RepID=A0A645ACR6_9ZZZZ